MAATGAVAQPRSRGRHEEYFCRDRGTACITDLLGRTGSGTFDLVARAGGGVLVLAAILLPLVDILLVTPGRVSVELVGAAVAGALVGTGLLVAPSIVLYGAKPHLDGETQASLLVRAVGLAFVLAAGVVFGVDALLVDPGQLGVTLRIYGLAVLVGVWIAVRPPSMP